MIHGYYEEYECVQTLTGHQNAEGLVKLNEETFASVGYR